MTSNVISKSENPKKYVLYMMTFDIPVFLKYISSRKVGTYSGKYKVNMYTTGDPLAK